MSVDFEAIAQRGRCDVSSLRLAQPLLEQGYTPPFLARYRRDELGGLDESSLWALSAAIETEHQIAHRRDELHKVWEQTALCDPAIGQAIHKSNSLRMLARLARRLKSESNEQSNDPAMLAVRVLNPQKGDGSDFAEIAQKVEGIQDADAAVAGLEQALAKRLAGDPRVIASAVRWLVKNAQIRVASVSDPHTTQDAAVANKADANKADANKADANKADANKADANKADANKAVANAAPSDSEAGTVASSKQQDSQSKAPSVAADADPQPADADPQPADADPQPAEVTVVSDESVVSADPATDTPSVEAAQTTEPTDIAATGETVAEATSSADPDASAEEAITPLADSVDNLKTDVSPESAQAETPTASPATVEASSTEQPSSSAEEIEIVSPESAAAEASPETAVGEISVAIADAGKTDADKTDADKTDAGKTGSGKKRKTAKVEAKAPKKQKKVSPRQRRRRWLVSVLKPLAGKRFACDKLSAFQVVMLGRALRSQVAECAFEYDAAKLVAELQRTAVGLNRHVEPMLRELVLANETVIREAAEAAWWDDLHERASARLVTITADHLRRHVNRGAVEAKVVMSIDAVGPRTAATSIVAADGRLLHNEDLPCQLSSANRSQAVARMGELIHAYHVDLLVISNGPARRATMIALGDLIGQSPEKSVRWTLGDRSGADVYASSAVADEEMRSTPRRFRAAAWLAFSVLQPAQALAKVDPLKLRLSSFQRELSDEALLSSLEEVLLSGASRGGVDANTASVSWLQRLPGVQEHVAQAIDKARRESLFNSRQSIVDLGEWGEATYSRQAIPFLRIFGSEEVLDGTLIHPEDYPLAKKLANALDIELPPGMPPGYITPDFTTESEPAAAKLIESTAEPEKNPVEDFSSATESSPSFGVDGETASSIDGQTPSESDEQASPTETATETEAETEAET
ncbi:MAG: helix-hairpin-helix domain-containing protein, partial [Rubripirellula sp.]|nr:helix-hairpin-helix domain-containing protein [Rubripirellula sp.]